MDKLNGLKITRRLIKEGKTDSQGACPIALAMRGKVDGTPMVNRAQTMIVKEGKGKAVYIKHTPELIDWIWRYDLKDYCGWEDPEPITLERRAGGYLGIKREG